MTSRRENLTCRCYGFHCLRQVYLQGGDSSAPDLAHDPAIRPWHQSMPAGRQFGIEKPAGFVVSAFEELKPEMKAKHYWYLRESASILHHPDILQSLFNACGLLKVMPYQG
jgi:hypothetical protein